MCTSDEPFSYLVLCHFTFDYLSISQRDKTARDWSLLEFNFVRGIELQTIRILTESHSSEQLQNIDRTPLF